MDGIRKIVSIASEIGDLKLLQDIDIGTRDRRTKIETLTQEADDLYSTFLATATQDQPGYYDMDDCYARLLRHIKNDNYDLRIFNRFKNDPIDDLEKFNNALITCETEFGPFLFEERTARLRLGDLIFYSSRPMNGDKILKIVNIRGVRNGHNAMVMNKNGDEIKLNKYQLSCCNLITRHHFTCDDEAMQKLDRGCLAERLLYVTMNDFF